ncbi:hypothetical protein HYU23_03290 [Candidatus Woesearchaeota archaeon]|nr:hypothetical protein [Candidatus Woesearchaeota archaeon]
MDKRGQVAVFAILGIVIVILVALFFFLRNEYGFFISPNVFLGDKGKPIENNLRECVTKVTDDALKLFSRQGGNFEPTRYILHQDNRVSYYCLNVLNDEKCLNVMPSFDELVGNLNTEINEGVNSCVDRDLVQSGLGYTVTAGKITTSVLSSDAGIAVKAHYDVKITRDENQYTIRDLNLNFDAPIESIYSVSVDIVNAEARVGFFEQLLYMLNKRGQYIINLDKPYPDKVYKIQKKDSTFEFWFAVEGERNI